VAVVVERVQIRYPVVQVVVVLGGVILPVPAILVALVHQGRVIKAGI
jgi:hypothetical protein